MEFEGIISGDGDCWCLEVTEEEYRKICGEKDYQLEMDYRNEMIKDGFPALAGKGWRIYPSNLFQALGCGDFPKGKVKFKLELLEHDPEVKSQADIEAEEGDEFLEDFDENE